MAEYLRGQIAEKANLNVETLRYYEKIKLLPAPARASSGYRLYPEAILKRLEFIKHAKDSGFTLGEIRQFFSIVDMDFNKINSDDIINLIDKKTEEIDSRIFELNKMNDILNEVKSNLQNTKQCPEIQDFFISLKNEKK